jgi:hypothetical protein
MPKPPPPRSHKRKPAPPLVPPPIAKPRRGKAPHEPSREDRVRVTAMVLAEGSPDHDTIARHLGISAKTLRKHYRYELDISASVIKSDIAFNVVTAARGIRADPARGIKAVPYDFKAAQFYLSTHGWVQSDRLIVADGGIDDSDLTALSDEQLNARLAQIERRRDRKRS